MGAVEHRARCPVPAAAVRPQRAFEAAGGGRRRRVCLDEGGARGEGWRRGRQRARMGRISLPRGGAGMGTDSEAHARARQVLANDIDLLHQPAELEKRKHKLKRLVQSPNSFFMDVKCQGCFNITTVFSHSQTVVMCSGCSAVLCQPTGGRARLTEGALAACRDSRFRDFQPAGGSAARTAVLPRVRPSDRPTDSDHVRFVP